VNEFDGIYINWGTHPTRFGVVEITYADCKSCTILMTPQKFIELFSDWKTKPIMDFGMEIHNLFRDNKDNDESWFSARPLIK
jgi:hypothetical protein